MSSAPVPLQAYEAGTYLHGTEADLAPGDPPVPGLRRRGVAAILDRHASGSAPSPFPAPLIGRGNSPALRPLRLWLTPRPPVSACVSGVVLESYGAEPWRQEPPVQVEEERLGVGLRVGLRVAGVWLLYVAGGALLPGPYGTGVLGGVSLGSVLALVPLGVGLHGVVAHGRRADRVAVDTDDRRWS